MYQAWYNLGVDTEIDDINKFIYFLKNIIKKNEYKNICFLGNSMGGYAAILFRALLNVDKVIAFSPQTFIDRKNRFLKYDNRWKKQLTKLYSTQKKVFIMI